MNLCERVELHRLLTKWTEEYGCDEMAAALVAAIKKEAKPSRTETETETSTASTAPAIEYADT